MQTITTTILTQNTGYAMLADIITALKNNISQIPYVNITAFTVSNSSTSKVIFTLPESKHSIEFQGYYDSFNYKYKIGFYVRTINDLNSSVSANANEVLNPNNSLIHTYYDNNSIVLVLDCSSLAFVGLRDITNKFWTGVVTTSNGISSYIHPTRDILYQTPSMNIYQFEDNKYPLYPVFPVYSNFAYPYQFTNLFQTSYLSSANLFTLYSIPMIIPVYKVSATTSYSLVIKFQ